MGRFENKKRRKTRYRYMQMDEDGHEDMTYLDGCHQQMNNIIFNIVKAKLPGSDHDSAVDQSNVWEQQIT